LPAVKVLLTFFPPTSPSVLVLFFLFPIDELRPEVSEKALLHLNLPQHEIIASLLLFSGSQHIKFLITFLTIFGNNTNGFGSSAASTLISLPHFHSLPPNKAAAQNR
jgi:hypothetical protein